MLTVGRVQPFIAHGGGTQKNCVFVRVETDDGLVGWGESFTQPNRDHTVVAHIDEIGRLLVGRSAFNIKHFCHVMYQDHVGMRGGLEFYAALSGIEQALWDIVGKAVGQPVYNLLGGACRPKIRVYANGWAGGDDPLDVIAECAQRTVAGGFNALKWDPFPGPRRAWIDPGEEAHAIGQVRAVREAVGPDIDLLIEVHRRLSPMHAVRYAHAIEEYRPFWYEEPVTPRNLSGLADVRRSTDLPVVAGEDLFTKYDFREVLERGAADIINPEVMLVGILGMKEIASMAEAYDVAVSPHGYGVCVGLAASVQVAAVMTNFLIADYFVPLADLAAEVAKTPFQVRDGYIELPTAPGLGFDLDEAALAGRGYQRLPTPGIRLFAQEGP